MNVPKLPVEKVTVPVGLIGDPRSTSLMVAVQVVGAATGTVDGVQLSVEVVARFATVRLNVLELVE